MKPPPSVSVLLTHFLGLSWQLDSTLAKNPVPWFVEGSTSRLEMGEGFQIYDFLLQKKVLPQLHPCLWEMGNPRSLAMLTRSG